MHEYLANVFSTPGVVGGVVIAGKTTVVYFFLVLGLRLMGKRELGQMTIYDLVLIIVLANSVQNAMVGSDNSLVGGIVAAVTLLIWNRVFTLLLDKSPKLERRMVGEPTILLNDGQLVESHMKREGITRDQVLAALREHGIESLEDAHMCVLEVDGTISVVGQDALVQKTRHHYRGLRLP